LVLFIRLLSLLIQKLRDGNPDDARTVEGLLVWDSTGGRFGIRIEPVVRPTTELKKNNSKVLMQRERRNMLRLRDCYGMQQSWMEKNMKARKRQ